MGISASRKEQGEPMFLKARTAFLYQRWKSGGELVKTIPKNAMQFSCALLVQLAMWGNASDSRART